MTLFILKGHNDPVVTLAVSQDGNSVASGTEKGEIRVWNAVAGKLRYMCGGHSFWVMEIAFMHDDKIIASADNSGSINFWEASTGALKNKFNTEQGSTGSSFSPDGTLFAVATKSDQIMLFDAVTGSVHSILVGHGESVLGIEFSPDGTVLASGSFEGTVKLWDIPTASNHDIVDTPPDVCDVEISPRGKFVASYQADSMKLWNTHTGHLELEGHAVAFNQNEDMVACALHNHTINLQNMKTGAPPLSLDGHTELVPMLAFSPDNKLLASASSDQTVNLWDVETGVLCRKFSCTHKIVEVVFSPNGKLLAIVLRDDIVELWNIATGTPHWAVQAPEGLEYVVFSPDGTLLASVSENESGGVSRVWNTTAKDSIELGNHVTIGRTFAFSPNSRLVVFVSGDIMLKLWDVTSGVVNNMLGGASDDSYPFRFTVVVFSPDGRLIASGDGSNVKLWDVESRTLVDSSVVNSDGQYMRSLSFSQDGRHLKSNLGYHQLRTNDHSCSDDCFYLSIRGNWICFGPTSFLWLPTDFRPSRSRCSVGVATVALVRPNGHPLIMTFDTTELARLFS